MSITELAERTVAVGLGLMKKEGVKIEDGKIYIPVQRNIVTQQAELFHPNEFVKWWNPEWTLSRSGYGAPEEDCAVLEEELLLTILYW